MHHAMMVCLSVDLIFDYMSQKDLFSTSKDRRLLLETLQMHYFFIFLLKNIYAGNNSIQNKKPINQNNTPKKSHKITKTINNK